MMQGKVWEMHKKIHFFIEQLQNFSEICSAESEMSQYWDGVIKWSTFLKNPVAADWEGDWKGHLQAVQDLLPVYCDSINY